MSRKSTHTATLPWALAVEIAGGEARLTEGIRARTWRWWRTRDAVPAHALVPFLLEHYLAARPVRRRA